MLTLRVTILRFASFLFSFTFNDAALCPALKSTSLDFRCTYEGSSVPCTESAKPNTTLHISCKPTYVPDDFAKFVEYITCLPDGNWNRALYTCIPTCGQGFPDDVPSLKKEWFPKPNDMPWHVPIYRKWSYPTYVCTGTIISRTLILSAAHCFYNQTTRSIMPGEQYDVVVAKYTADYSKLDDPQTKVFNVAKVHVPDSYNGEDTWFTSDIALLELKEPITMNSKVMPVCVEWSPPLDNKPPENGTVAWWNRETGKPEDAPLVAVTLPFITRQECRSMVDKYFWPYASPLDKFCSGSISGPGVKLGSTGSGWIYKKDRSYFIYGITSTKPPNSYVAAFTRVSSHLDWIDNVLKHTLATEPH